VETFV
jgi:hypothetical protein